MLTANYLQRSLFRWEYVILIISIISAAAAVFSFQINRWLPGYALSYSNLIAQQSQTKISFQEVRYRLPDNILFKNVKVFGLDGNAPMLQAPRVIVGFNKITVDGMAVNFPVLKNYLVLHGQKIYAQAVKAPPKGNMRLVVPNGQFYPNGFSPGEPVAFNVDLGLNGGRVSVHGAWGGWSSMNLWGSRHDNDIEWKGFIFYDKYYILDIDGHLEIQKKDIVLQQLTFSVNGDAVGALGRCSKEDLFQCDADIASKNFDLHLHAQNTLQGLSFKGAADFDRAHVDFKNLKAFIINGNALKLKIGQVQSVFSIRDNEYRIPLENILTSISFAEPYRKAIALSAEMFTGHLYSRIFLNTASLPWQIKSQGRFKGIKIAQGLLSGSFDLQSSKDIELSGVLALHNGHFDNSRFQGWLAKTLQMPSLDHISGADLSCRFKIDGRSKMVEDLKLNTDDFNLGGFFHLDADDLVSSRGSVRFSKKLLSESAIGRHIIGLVRGAWTLPFEFRLSGNMYRMNFQWDNSPLKDKVRQHLFSFFERMIDRRMDAHPYSKVTIPNESVSPG